MENESRGLNHKIVKIVALLYCNNATIVNKIAAIRDFFGQRRLLYAYLQSV